MKMSFLMRLFGKKLENERNHWYNDFHAQIFLSRQEGNEGCTFIDDCQKFSTGFASWNLCFGQPNKQERCECYIMLYRTTRGSYPVLEIED